MKKIMYTVLVCNILFFLAVNFLNFSLNNQNSIYANKTYIEIEKPGNMTNRDFLSKLTTLIEGIDTDILYVTIDLSKNKTTYMCYKTNKSDGFLNLNVDGNTLLTNDEFLSTTGETGSRKVHGSSLMNDVYVYSLQKAEQLNLEHAAYYVPSSDTQRIIDLLNSNEIEVNTPSRNLSNDGLDFLYFQAILLLFLLLSILFYVFVKNKEIVIKKTNGYSNINLIIDELRINMPVFFLIFLIIFAVLSVVAGLLYGYITPLLFLEFVYKSIILGAVLICVIFLLPCLYICFQNGHESYKGKHKNTELYVVSLITNIVALFVLIPISISSVGIFEQLTDLNASSRRLAKNTNGYVSLAFYSFVQPSEDSQINDIQSALKLYKETKDEFKGIIVKLEYGGTDLTINEYYLDINPIHTADGKELTSEDIPDDKYVVLIPDNISTQQWIEENTPVLVDYLGAFQIPFKKDDLLIIKYKSGEKLQLFSPGDIQEGNEYAKDPIITIYNEKYQPFTSANYINSNYYLRTKTDNTYSEIYPYLKSANLENIVLETPFISSTFAERIREIMMSFYITSISIAVNIFVLLIVIMYSSKVYCQNYMKEITIRRLSGYSFFNIYKMLLLIKLGLFLVFIIIYGLGGLLNFGVVFAVSMVDMLSFYITIKNQEKKSINSTIKGDS